MIKIKTNTLYHYANEYRKNLTEESEIEQQDMTEVLEREEELMIENGEIIIENINAKMRLGKSTLAIARAKRIHDLLKEKGKLPKNKPFNMSNIARDDQEFSKIMRDPTINNTIIVTDESNELEQTGENVTVENALKKVFSDVQAGRYVHRICCSPKDSVDPNADILLSVIAIDQQKNITRSKLYYRYFEGGTEYTQLLGYVDTDVTPIIKTWKKVKDIFYKRNKTPTEKRTLEHAEKTDFYTQYIIKKYEKMELITKEGIMRPRELEYATPILRVIQQLKTLAKFTSVSRNVVTNYIKMYYRDLKLASSMVGEELATRRATAILDQYTEIQKFTKKIKKLHKENREQPNDETELEISEMTQARNDLISSVKIQEAELEHYIKVNNKYHGGH